MTPVNRVVIDYDPMIGIMSGLCDNHVQGVLIKQVHQIGTMNEIASNNYTDNN